MKKTTILIVIMLFPILGFSQSAIWKKTNEQKLTTFQKVRRNSVPSKYELFNLDIDAFKSQLAGAPVRGEFSGRSKKVIFLPNAEGQIQRFYVMETPIMERELAEKFPMIKSYAAQGVDDPTAIARFSVTQFGLHSMTFSGDNSTVYIDPYTEDTQNYIVYSRASLGQSNQSFECLSNADIELPSLEGRNSFENTILNTNDKKLRTYRLAQSCTGEYGALFAGTGTVAQQKANVQARMAITMTRVNGVYEKDLAITMIFVANNDQIIYLNAATDPWNGEFNSTTGQVIDAAIGFNNYDIGHNFNTSGGGNAGCIGCVCSTSTNPNGGFHKGTGMTGSSNPTGDPFDIDYVAHEMGHQFGGFHTQSSANCRSGSGETEVEPGSGSTIMAYAGICPANVQNQSDAYFTYVNIRDILLNVKSGVSSACAQVTNFSNNPPTANAGKDYIIPKSTAFILTGSGSDPDGDLLTYTWEENDPQDPNSPAAPTPTRVSGPMFRSIWGTSSPTRYMPMLSTVLSGQTANTWEVVPSVARELNFSLTVRDNVAGGGQTASDLMKVTVNGTAGPFVITSPNTNVSYVAGSNQTVTWNVAGTTANGVNTPYVDIYLSTNAGSTFPVLLASRVPNDGSEVITIPNTPGTQNRIMVKGNENIFYDLSNTNFTITAPASTFAIAFSGVEGEQNKSVCKGNNITYSIPYTALGGFTSTTTFSVSGQPVGSTATVTPGSLSANGSLTLTVSNTTSSTPGFYTLVVTGTSGATSRTVNFYLNLLNNAFSAITLTSPTNGQQVSPSSVILDWTPSASATMYDVQIATDNSFTNIVNSTTVSTNSYAVPSLPNVSTFYWRVLPRNSACNGVFSSSSNFVTTYCGSIQSTNVPVIIPSNGTPTVNSTITIDPTQNITINHIDVTLNISHSWINDLTATLISPSGTQVQLFANQCSPDDPISNVIATFDDAGLPLVCGTNPGISGVVIPAQSLSVLNGQSSQGVWTLRVADGFNQDGGQINGWSLNICSVQPPLSTNENTFSDFVLYPNPNNGNFNIQFTSSSSNRVKIAVYDMRGRIIFENDYANQAVFNENIQLNNVQAGVYLLNVTDGDRKEVKRIVIN